MSHDRGCFKCGRDQYEYRACTEKVCVKADLVKSNQKPKPGIGAKMAGGNSATGRLEDDFYATPWEATVALLGVEKFDGDIHECCCGDGRMGKILEAAGYHVIGTDIKDRGYGSVRDIFDIKAPLAPNIVTNPPFGTLAPKIIKHALEHLKPKKMALLLKATFWHAANRVAMFERTPPARIRPLSWRLDFKNLGRPTMECSWYIWEEDHTGEPTYCRPLDKPLKQIEKIAA